MKNVLLVFGGKSYEHDISVVTASQIYNKCKIDGIKLIPLYLSRNNEFFVYTASIFDLKDFSIKNFKNSIKLFKEVAFVSGETCRLFAKTRFGLKEYGKKREKVYQDSWCTRTQFKRDRHRYPKR